MKNTTQAENDARDYANHLETEEKIATLEARIQSLLESNNELFERARLAERQCLVKDTARVVLEEKYFSLMTKL